MGIRAWRFISCSFSSWSTSLRAAPGLDMIRRRGSCCGSTASASKSLAGNAEEIYQSPLVTRNAGEQMLRLFSPAHKIRLWRRLWLELARNEQALGITRISDEALRQMEQKLDDIDFARAADWEK